MYNIEYRQEWEWSHSYICIKGKMPKEILALTILVVYSKRTKRVFWTAIFRWRKLQWQTVSKIKKKYSKNVHRKRKTRQPNIRSNNQSFSYKFREKKQEKEKSVERRHFVPCVLSQSTFSKKNSVNLFVQSTPEIGLWTTRKIFGLYKNGVNNFLAMK